ADFTVVVTPYSLRSIIEGRRPSWRNASVMAIVAAIPTLRERSRGRMGMRSRLSAGAREAAIIDSKSCRLDDGRIHAEAGAGAHHRAGVLRDIGLKQGEQERRGRLGHHPYALPAGGQNPKRGVESGKCRHGVPRGE